jgi:hypothetical protein
MQMLTTLKLIVYPQLNADIRRLYTLKDSFAGSAKQYFHRPLGQLLTRPPRNRQRSARASGLPAIKPAQLHHQHWLCHLFSNNFH